MTPMAAPDTSTSTSTVPAGELEHRWVAPNYAPLPVTLVEGEGAWVVDDEGRRYLDLLSAYSALNFGHRHPRLVAAAHAQLDKLTLTSWVGSPPSWPSCAAWSGSCR
jgi:acetylornithine/succinyldiaminopimelate/putrescine aminotransferase